MQRSQWFNHIPNFHPCLRWLLKSRKATGGSEGATENELEWGEAAKDEICEAEIKEFIENVSAGRNSLLKSTCPHMVSITLSRKPGASQQGGPGCVSAGGCQDV
jgi:hypothetical protein